MKTGGAVIQQNAKSDTFPHTMKVTLGMDKDLEAGIYRHLTLASSVTLRPNGITLLTYKLREVTPHGAMVFFYRFLRALETAHEEGQGCMPLLRDL